MARPDSPPRPVDERDGVDDHSLAAAEEWPQLDPEVEAIVVRLDKAHRLITTAERASLKRVGLTHEEFKVLIRLWREPRSHGALCEDLMVSTGSMTNRLDKLEQAGYVQRRRDPKDRRGVLLELTPAGRAKLDAYVDIQSRREIELLGLLDAADKEQLNRILKKFLAALQPGPERD